MHIFARYYYQYGRLNQNGNNSHMLGPPIQPQRSISSGRSRRSNQDFSNYMGDYHSVVNYLNFQNNGSILHILFIFCFILFFFFVFFQCLLCIIKYTHISKHNIKVCMRCVCRVMCHKNNKMTEYRPLLPSGVMRDFEDSNPTGLRIVGEDFRGFDRFVNGQHHEDSDDSDFDPGLERMPPDLNPVNIMFFFFQNCLLCAQNKKKINK